jgi:hypothetical protein
MYAVPIVAWGDEAIISMSEDEAMMPGPQES